ncbi:MAG: DUF4340 domain-containing protein [candidate division KSB1 bacterium]|nr:DUF4340 domain-containing protein [candidate division KSB1 bacterium]MDZ7345173.1 DUF4340 domain-containing protein [candidate division KSB1 bacterium]
MKFKNTLILAVILAIGIGGVVLMNKQDKRREETKKSEEKVLEFETGDIQRVALLQSGIEAVKDSLSWRITQPVQTEADKSAIETLINSVKSARKERIISSDPSEYSVFGLQPPLHTLVLARASRIDTLYIGDDSPTGSYVFARLSGSPDVFLTSTWVRTQAEKTLFDLRNKAVLGFETFQVRSLQLQNRHGRFALEKQGGEWKITSPIQAAADKSEVEKVINRLQSERMRSIVVEQAEDLKSYGLDAPKVRVELALGENLARKTLLIGKATEDKYYARDESRPMVFLVDSSFVSVLNPTLFDLRDKKLAKFASTDVSKFELEFHGQTIVCSKDTSGTWTVEQPERREGKSWKMSSIVREAADLEVKKFVDQPVSPAVSGLNSPQVRAKFYQNDKVVMDIALGKVEGDLIYAKLADQPALYLVDKKVLETWTPKLDDISEVKAQTESTPAQ